jgi:hypothetical protein
MHNNVLPIILQTKIIDQLSTNITAGLCAASCFNKGVVKLLSSIIRRENQLSMHIYTHKKGGIDSAISSIFVLYYSRL